MNKQIKTKCDFCKYKSSGGCMVTANSLYCKEANNEYYQYLKSKSTVSTQPVVKSLRPWYKNKLN